MSPNEQALRQAIREHHGILADCLEEEGQVQAALVARCLAQGGHVPGVILSTTLTAMLVPDGERAALTTVRLYRCERCGEACVVTEVQTVQDMVAAARVSKLTFADDVAKAMRAAGEATAQAFRSMVPSMTNALGSLHLPAHCLRMQKPRSRKLAPGVHEIEYGFTQHGGSPDAPATLSPDRS